MAHFALPQAPLNVRPSVRSYNSWDSTRYSQRVIPTIHETIDTFDPAPTIEAQTRRPSVVTVRVDESPPSIIYRLGWRSILQIVGVGVATCTLGIASSNLYLRLHHAVQCDIPHLPPQ